MLLFTKRADRWLARLGVGGVAAVALLITGLYYYAPPEYTRVGYAPKQPVPFSHAQHVGQLGLSCLYCHTNVDKSPHASVPATQTCMSCHQTIKADSPKLAAVRQSWSTGDPIPWKRVHKTPDYVSFDHAVHVRRGVGCVSCHGKVNEMPVMVHDQPLSMGWCLECHRHPENQLRPPSEVTNLTFDWKPPEGRTQSEFRVIMKEELRTKAPLECAGCHQ
jgi:hypothetical protein